MVNLTKDFVHCMQGDPALLSGKPFAEVSYGLAVLNLRIGGSAKILSFSHVAPAKIV